MPQQLRQSALKIKREVAAKYRPGAPLWRKMDSTFDPDLHLDYIDRGNLAQMAAMPGYKVLHKICRSEVDKFIVSLINEESGPGVESAHRMAKAAAQFYTGVTNRVNEEVLQYTAAPRDTDKPQDVTEGILDIGRIAAATRDLPNLLEGDEYE
jgi:hypothetical protein